MQFDTVVRASEPKHCLWPIIDSDHPSMCQHNTRHVQIFWKKLLAQFIRVAIWHCGQQAQYCQWFPGQVFIAVVSKFSRTKRPKLALVMQRNTVPQEITDSTNCIYQQEQTLILAAGLFASSPNLVATSHNTVPPWLRKWQPVAFGKTLQDMVTGGFLQHSLCLQISAF